MQGSSNKAWHIAQGPLSVVFGFGLGAIAAFCCSATRLWNNKYKRVLALVISGGRLACVHVLHQHKPCRSSLLLVRCQLICEKVRNNLRAVLFDTAALTMKYFFDQFDFESGGALAALMLGLVVKEFWRRQWPRCLALQVGCFMLLTFRGWHPADVLIADILTPACSCVMAYSALAGIPDSSWRATASSGRLSRCPGWNNNTCAACRTMSRTRTSGRRSTLCASCGASS